MYIYTHFYPLTASTVEMGIPFIFNTYMKRDLLEIFKKFHTFTQ